MSFGADPPRIVLDSNVLASGIGFPRDTPSSKILRLAKEGRIRLYVSAFIMVEVERFLRRKTTMDLDAIVHALENLRTMSRLVRPSVRVKVIKRKDSDNRILECALAAQAPCLVSGGRRDLLPLAEHEGIPTISPREFMDRWFGQA